MEQRGMQGSFASKAELLEDSDGADVLDVARRTDPLDMGLAVDPVDEEPDRLGPVAMAPFLGGSQHVPDVDVFEDGMGEIVTDAPEERIVRALADRVPGSERAGIVGCAFQGLEERRVLLRLVPIERRDQIRVLVPSEDPLPRLGVDRHELDPGSAESVRHGSSAMATSFRLNTKPSVRGP